MSFLSIGWISLHGVGQGALGERSGVDGVGDILGKALKNLGNKMVDLADR